MQRAVRRQSQNSDFEFRRRVGHEQCARLAFHLPPVLEPHARAGRAEKHGLAEIHVDGLGLGLNGGQDFNFKLICPASMLSSRNQ